MPHEGAGGDPCKVLLHPYLLPFLGDFGAGWALGAPHGAPWAVCRGHPIISSPSPLPCSKSILSSRRWRRSMEGSEAAPSLPASSPHFWRSGMGGGTGYCLWCREHPKTISPSPFPCFKSTFSKQAWALGLWIPHGRAAGELELLSLKSPPALGSQL